MNKIMKILSLGMLLAVVLLPALAFAGEPPPSVINLPNPLNMENFEDLIDAVVDWLLVITLPIVALIIVFAGAQYMFAGVNPEQQRKAKNIILYALIGYAIILLSKVLLAVVTGIFG